MRRIEPSDKGDLPSPRGLTRCRLEITLKGQVTRASPRRGEGFAEGAELVRMIVD
jgi:hypothetical protein